jgi:hypothetical protein
MIENPETPHKPHGIGNKWFDAGIAVALTTVSLASLIVAVHTSITMEALVRQNERMVQASSTPILLFSHGDESNGVRQISFTLSNRGTGPARVVWLEVRRTAQPYNSLGELLDELWRADPGRIAQAPHMPQPHVATTPTSPIILGAKDEVDFLTWTRPADPAQAAVWDALDHARWGLQTQACYCSVLNECWISRLAGEIPTQVPSCDATGHTRLQG